MSQVPKDQYEHVITEWVRWFRGVNDPKVQRKVAERQVGVLTAEKNISSYDIVYGGKQRPRVVLYAPSVRALGALQWAVARMLPKTKYEVLVDDEKSIRPKTLGGYLKSLGNSRAELKKKS